MEIILKNGHKITDLRKERTLKVSYARGNTPKDVPYLALTGRWFQLLGYEVGDKVKITIDENNKITIEKAINS